MDGATARFRHPNIWHTRCRVYELKQYLRSGAKRWRSRAGISHYLIISRDRIQLYLEKGFSYVRVVMNIRPQNMAYSDLAHALLASNAPTIKTVAILIIFSLPALGLFCRFIQDLLDFPDALFNGLLEVAG